MVRLEAPTTPVHASFLAAMAEFRAEGRGAPTDPTEIGREIRTSGASWRSPEGFDAYVRRPVEQAREDSLTFDPDNAASRTVIERNGGVPQDRPGDKWRCRVPTVSTPTAPR